jgi:hypothetical protein
MAWIGRTVGYVLWLLTKWGALVLIAESTWVFFKSLMDGLSVTKAMDSYPSSSSAIDFFRKCCCHQVHPRQPSEVYGDELEHRVGNDQRRKANRGGLATSDERA